MIFADTSAVLKLYADEVGSDEMRTLPLLLVSALCRVEGTSAIWRKSRIGDLTEDDAANLIRRFQTDLMTETSERTNLIALPVTPDLLRMAAGLVPLHDLRSLDAIQLSSALAAREAVPECDTFACYDKNLARAAMLNGFSVHSPS